MSQNWCFQFCSTANSQLFLWLLLIPNQKKLKWLVWINGAHSYNSEQFQSFVVFLLWYWFIFKLNFLKIPRPYSTAWERKIVLKIKPKRTSKGYKFCCNSPIKSACRKKLKGIGSELASRSQRAITHRYLIRTVNCWGSLPQVLINRGVLASRQSSRGLNEQRTRRVV